MQLECICLNMLWMVTVRASGTKQLSNFIYCKRRQEASLIRMTRAFQGILAKIPLVHADFLTPAAMAWLLMCSC